MAVVLKVSSGFVITAPTADPAGTNTTIDGSSVVTKDTAPAGETITITEIGWYRGSGTNTANFEIALYSEGSGVANTRLNVDATNSSSVQGWVIVAVSWSITAGTAYWLAVQMDAHTGSSTIDTNTSGGVGADVLTSQTTLADPYGGGAVADADGMYAIYAKLSIVRNIAVPVGALTLTGFAPSVVATNHKNITIGLGALTLVGFNPTVSVTNNKNISPSLGELIAAGFVPTVAVTNNLNISADDGALLLTGFAPTIELPVNKTTSTGDLILTGFNPTVIASDHKNVAPGLGEVIISGFAPTVNVSSGLSPSTGELSLVGFSPTVNVTDHKNIIISLGELVLNGFNPTINIGVNLSPQTGELIAAGFNPTVSVSNNISVSPGLGELVLNGFTPVVDNGDGAAVVTSLGELIMTGFAPTVEGGNNEFLNLGSPINSPSLGSEILEASTHSRISTLRRKSKIENDI